MSENGLPRGWITAKIGDLVAPNGVFSDGDWVESKDQDPAGDVRLVQLADVGDGRYVNKSSRFLTRRKAAELRCKFLTPGDLLIARMPDPLGRACVFPGDPKPCVTVVDVCIVRVGSSEVSHRWLMYTVNSPEFRAAVSSLQSGSTRKRISRGNLATLDLPVPPLPEQHRIVEEIEKQFSRLDAGVAALKRTQACLRRYRTSVLQAACEGRLVPTEAELARTNCPLPLQGRAGAGSSSSSPSPLTGEGRGEGETSQSRQTSGTQEQPYEPADQLLERILAERRAKWNGKGKYKEPAAPDTTDLPELPEGWCWATVEQIAASEPNSITDGPFGSNLKTCHYTDCGPRVIRLQNIGNGVFIDEYAHISEDHFRRLGKHRILKGDIVIAAFGDSPPRACVVPSSVGPAIVKADCIRLKPDGSAALARYVNYALNFEGTRSRAKLIVHGIGRPRLNLGEIKSIALPIPPLPEQHRIVAEVERRLSVIDQLESVVNANLKRAERLRQAILKRAFEGKLVAQEAEDGAAAQPQRAKKVNNACVV